VDFVNIKENFDATNDRYLRELNRTADIEETGEKETVGEALIVDKEQIIEQIKEIRNILFNYTCDNLEEFRKEIDEIENKENLYTLRSTLENAKAIINQIRAFGDEELKEKIDSLPKGSIPTLITEVSHRIERMNLLESTEHKADVSGIINVALSELEFEFKKGISEELRIIVNDIRERCERVQAEFEANFDRTEDKYVILADEFREYFRKKGFVPQSTQDAKESIDYMDAVMKKIREINRRNNILKKKYQGDERFVRIHKRIEEENEKRERPIISKAEYEIAESLSKMKREIDNRIYLDINIIANENSFKRDTLAMIGHQLIDLGINASISDRKFINNLIANEYINQYNQVHLR
jgi:type I restriction enzyme R subunit